MNERINLSSRHVLRLLAVLLAADAVFILLHTLFGWSVINLDEEGNLTAWYSSGKLLLIGLAAAWVYFRERRPGRDLGFRLSWLWLVVAAIFLLLSADETASLHERLARGVMQGSELGEGIREKVLGGDHLKDSFAWVIILLPPIMVVAGFLVVFFYKRLRLNRPARNLALAAVGLFLGAVALEATMYGFPPFAEWTERELTLYKRLLTIEETCEMMGTTFFLFAFLRYGISIARQ